MEDFFPNIVTMIETLDVSSLVSVPMDAGRLLSDQEIL